MQLSNKVCVITGASSGIGKALALELARRGNKLALLSRRKPELEEVAHQVGVYGGQALAIPGDIARITDVEVAFQLTQERFGTPDVVIANAGFNCQDPPTDISIEHLQEIVDVNFVGAMWTINCALKRMLPEKRGHLVGVCSVAGYRGLPRGAVYAATKAGFRSYLESIRLTYARQGICVTTVCPGFVRTPMIERAKYPTPFCVDAENAAMRIVRAIERNRSELVFPWQMSLLVKLGGLLPNWLYDRLLSRVPVGD